MSLPVFSTKLLVPSLSSLRLSRPRIDESWVGREGIRLVTVSAGAGWGKTTSIVAALQKEKRRIVWYSLDNSDKDIGVFLTHLASAENLSIHSSNVLTESQESAFLSAIISHWQDHDRGTVLVLDDLQFLGSHSPVHGMIQRLVRYLPSTCTVVLASREPIAFPTTKYQSQEQVIVLKTRDLAFNKEEIRDLFQMRTQHATLKEFQLDQIFKHSEGWAAGLQIFFQTLPGKSVETLDQAVSRIGSAGTDWFSYFAEEVISGLDEDLQNFLVRTAILPFMEAELCDRLLGSRNSHKMLATLSDRNLFTFSTGGKERIYRYHHLFREFLLSQLQIQQGNQEVDRWRLKAGKVFARSRRWVEAACLLSQCEEKKPALDLLGSKADELLTTGRFMELGQALEQLGTKAVSQRAEVLYLLGQVQNIKGRWELAETTYRRALRKKPTPDRRVELKSLIAQIHMRFGQYERCLRLCRRAQNSEDKIKSQVKARLLGLQGVSSCALGRLDQGEVFLNEAIKSCRRTRNRGAEGRNLFLLAANVHFFRGDFPLAQESARSALKIFQDLDDRRLICHSLGVLGFVLIAAGQKTEAEVHSRDALRRAESLGYRNIEGYCHLNLGECALLAGETEAAQRHYKIARDVGHEVGEIALKSLSLVGLAQVALDSANLLSARRQAQAAYKAASDPFDMWPTAQACLVLGLAYVEKPATSKKYWNEAETILAKLGARFELARLELWRLSENLVPDNEIDHRIRAFLIQISEESFDFLLLELEPRRAAIVLSQISQEDLLEDDLLEFVNQMKYRLGINLPEQNSISVPMKISALGSLQVIIGKRTLTRKDWNSTRAFRLFSYFLVRRFHWVVKDEIIEALWPNADPVKASNNLRQTVHLLRKIFSPEGNCPYVQLRDDTYSLQIGTKGYYDVEVFEEALHNVQVSGRQGKAEEIQKNLKQALDLYKGPFLMEAPYESFTQNERDSLHLSHQRTVKKLLRIFEQQGQWEEALTLCLQVLPYHPHHDYFHEILIRAHLSFGHRKEALECYRKHEKSMLADMDLLPSDTLQQLAEQAAGKTIS